MFSSALASFFPLTLASKTKPIEKEENKASKPQTKATIQSNNQTSSTESSLPPEAQKQNQTSSKKKKKRSKKKKSNEVKINPSDNNESDDDNEAEEVEVNPTDSDLKSNTIITVAEVFRRSGGVYTKERISQCTMSMWDKGLSYDNADAVLNLLKQEDEMSLAYESDTQEIESSPSSPMRVASDSFAEDDDDSKLLSLSSTPVHMPPPSSENVALSRDDDITFGDWSTVERHTIQKPVIQSGLTSSTVSNNTKVNGAKKEKELSHHYDSVETTPPKTIQDKVIRQSTSHHPAKIVSQVFSNHSFPMADPNPSPIVFPTSINSDGNKDAIISQLEALCLNPNIDEVTAILLKWAQTVSSSSSSTEDNLCNLFFESQKALESYLLQLFISSASWRVGSSLRQSIQKLFHLLLLQIPVAGSSNLVSSSLEVNAIAAATFAVDNILSTFDGVIERTERLVQMTSPGMQASISAYYNMLSRRIANALKKAHSILKENGNRWRVVLLSRKENYDLKSVDGKDSVFDALSDLDKEMHVIDQAIHDLKVDEEKKKGKVAPPPGSSSIGLELQSSLTLRDMTCEKLDLHLKGLDTLKSSCNGSTSGPKFQQDVVPLNPFIASLQSLQRDFESGAVVKLEKSIASYEANVALEKQILTSYGESLQSIESKCARGADVVLLLQRLQAERDRRASPLSQELDACNNMINELTQRQVILQQQLHNVQLELNAVSARRSTLNAALADCQANFDNDFRKAEVAHQDIVAVVKLRDNVTALLNQVQSVDHALADALGISANGSSSRQLLQYMKLRVDELNESTKTAENKKPEALFPVRVQAAVQSFQEFSEMQSKCISLLSRRVILTKSQLNHMKDELVVYKNLSMQSIVHDTEQNIAGLVENIDEDIQALQHLQGELVEALRKLTRFLTAGIAGLDHVTIPGQSLAAIATALEQAGVAILPEILAFKATTPSPKPSQPVVAKPSPSHTKPVAAANASAIMTPAPAVKNGSTAAYKPSTSSAPNPAPLAPQAIGKGHDKSNAPSRPSKSDPKIVQKVTNMTTSPSGMVTLTSGPAPGSKQGPSGSAPDTQPPPKGTKTWGGWGSKPTASTSTVQKSSSVAADESHAKPVSKSSSNKKSFLEIQAEQEKLDVNKPERVIPILDKDFTPKGAVSNAVVKESDFVAYLDNVDDVPNDDEEAPVERELLNPAGIITPVDPTPIKVNGKSDAEDEKEDEVYDDDTFEEDEDKDEKDEEGDGLGGYDDEQFESDHPQDEECDANLKPSIVLNKSDY